MRNTQPRKIIFDLLMTSEVALSHSEIKESIKSICDRVTIYRVLDKLLIEGFVHKVVTNNGVIKYAKCFSCSNNHQHNHIHFSCLKCLAVECLQTIEPIFNIPKEYKVTEVNFIVSGYCPKCSS